MENKLDVLIVNALFDKEALLEQRTWSPLCEDVFSSVIYESDSNNPKAAFLHYLPGASVPEHQHVGIEHILILHGSQIDGDKIYTPGTLVIHGPDTHHNLKSPEGCIALGIWQKPVMFI